ncbi:MAG: hypothetical protein ACK44M_04605 [Chloroflexus sp.]
MRRPAIITFLIMATVFFGGALGGFALTTILIPEPHVLRWFSLGALPLAFTTGSLLWLSIAFSRGLFHIIKWRERPTFAGDRAIPPGTTAFIVTSAGIMTLFGLLVAVTPNRLGFLPTLALFTGAGVGYGLLCRVLARNGYLPVYALEGE